MKDDIGGSPIAVVESLIQETTLAEPVIRRLTELAAFLRALPPGDSRLALNLTGPGANNALHRLGSHWGQDESLEDVVDQLHELEVEDIR